MVVFQGLSFLSSYLCVIEMIHASNSNGCRFGRVVCSGTKPGDAVMDGTFPGHERTSERQAPEDEVPQAASTSTGNPPAGHSGV